MGLLVFLCCLGYVIPIFTHCCGYLQINQSYPRITGKGMLDVGNVSLRAARSVGALLALTVSWYSLESPQIKKSQLSTYLYLVALWLCLWKTVLIVNWYGRSQTPVGSSIPWIGGLGLFNEAIWVGQREPASSILLWFLLWLPSVMGVSASDWQWYKEECLWTHHDLP